jgi:hypothetical protein
MKGLLGLLSIVDVNTDLSLRSCYPKAPKPIRTCHVAPLKVTRLVDFSLSMSVRSMGATMDDQVDSDLPCH